MAGRVVSTQRPRWSTAPTSDPPLEVVRTRAVVAVQLAEEPGRFRRPVRGGRSGRPHRQRRPRPFLLAGVLTVTAAATFLYGGRPGAHHTSATRPAMGRRSSSSTSSSAEPQSAAAVALALTEAMQMDPAATARPGRDRAPGGRGVGSGVRGVPPAGRGVAAVRSRRQARRGGPGSAAAGSPRTPVTTCRDELRDWTQRKVIRVAGRGFTTAQNRRLPTAGGGSHILGEKGALRLPGGGRRDDRARPLPGRDREPAGQGSEDQRSERFVVCHNPNAATRDAAVRANLVDRLDAMIAGSTGSARPSGPSCAG
jgi:hypothetical protein